MIKSGQMDIPNKMNPEQSDTEKSDLFKPLDLSEDSQPPVKHHQDFTEIEIVHIQL